MQGISGITGAAPLFRDVMIELHRDKYPTLFRRPITLEKRQICLRTGMLARAACSNQIEEIFLPGTSPIDSCYGQGLAMGAGAIHYRESTGNREEEKDLTILNPGNGDIFRIDPQVSSKSQIIKLRIRAVNSIESVKLLMDGKVIGVEQYPFEFLWQPIRGKHVLEARAEKGDTDAKDRIAFTIY